MNDELNGKIKKNDLRERTKQYAKTILHLYSLLPTSTVFQIIGKQFVRSGTSVGAQYREACRAKSDADMITKFEGMLQELDETDYWLDLLCDHSQSHKEQIESIRIETNELIAIFTASVRTIKSRRKK